MNLTNPTYSLAFRACEITGISESRVFSKEKSHRVHQIRYAVWHVLRKRGGITFAEMAIPFDMGHDSAMHGVKKATGLLANDEWFRGLVGELENAKPCGGIPSASARGSEI